MNFYNEIKNRLIDNEIYAKVKDYLKERNRVTTYFEIGKLLYRAGNKYGDGIINNYSERLKKEVGRKYDKTTLFRMRQLYLVFNNQKVAPLVQQLTWSHCLLLLPIKNIDKLNYYINQIINKSLSKRQLQDAIKSKEYERLPDETKLKLIENKDTEVKDFVKNPIVIKNNGNYKDISEKVLQKLILEDIPSFLEELGEGFTFIKNEYKIKMGNSYNY